MSNNKTTGISGNVYFQSPELSKSFILEMEKILELSSNILNKADISILKMLERIIEICANFNTVATTNIQINDNNVLIGHLKVYKQSLNEIFKKNSHDNEDGRNVMKNTLIKICHSIEQLMEGNDNVIVQSISLQIKNCINQLKLFYGEITIPKTQFIENAKQMIAYADKLINLVKTRAYIIPDNSLSLKLTNSAESLELNIKNLIKISSSYLQRSSNAMGVNESNEKEQLIKTVGVTLKDLINFTKIKSGPRIELIFSDRVVVQKQPPMRPLPQPKQPLQQDKNGITNSPLKNGTFNSLRESGPEVIKKFNNSSSVRGTSTSSPKLEKEHISVSMDNLFRRSEDNNVLNNTNNTVNKNLNVGTSNNKGTPIPGSKVNLFNNPYAKPNNPNNINNNNFNKVNVNGNNQSNPNTNTTPSPNLNNTSPNNTNTRKVSSESDSLDGTTTSNKNESEAFKEESLKIANQFNEVEDHNRSYSNLSRLSTETNISSGDMDSDENEIFQFLMDISSGSSVKESKKKNRISIMEYAGKLSKKTHDFVSGNSNRNSTNNNSNNSNSNNFNTSLSNSTLEIPSITQNSLLTILSLIDSTIISQSATGEIFVVEIEYENERILIQKQNNVLKLGANPVVVSSFKEKFCKAIEIFDLGLKDGNTNTKESVEKIIEPLVKQISELNKQVLSLTENMKSFQENTDIKFRKLQEGPVEKFPLNIPKEPPFSQQNNTNNNNNNNKDVPQKKNSIPQVSPVSKHKNK